MSSTVHETLKNTKNASIDLATLSNETRVSALNTFADLIESNRSELLDANKKDLSQSKGKIPDALFQRLGLSDERITGLAQGVRDVAQMKDPVGEVLEKIELDDGLVLTKVSVPLGVVAVVFESRPDVIPQILSLFLRSGNAAALKGGSEALNTNQAFMKIIEAVNAKHPELPNDWACLLESRGEFQEMLKYPDCVDLVIPRGSSELVEKVTHSTQIPVLGHTEGVCHLYVHEDAEVESAVSIAIDSKAQYPSACNAIETLLVHEKKAKDFLTAFEKGAQNSGIELLGCDETRKILSKIKAASDSDWKTEYSSLKLSIKVVRSLEEAIEHINRYGSHHTDSIVSRDTTAQEKFFAKVDSASVFANASTRFADGYRYGKGAEIGISTNKTHARGPVGIEGLLIYKYVLRGNNQIVASYSGPNAKPFTHRPISKG